MLIQNYIYIAFALSLAGTLFALYMSLHSFILKECPFNEECPHFLGFPACYFGFLMFFAMLITTSLSIWNNLEISTTKQILEIVSVMGIIFSGSYVVGDIKLWLVNGRKYGLVLPSCAYGLIFYFLIFAISFFQ